MSQGFALQTIIQNKRNKNALIKRVILEYFSLFVWYLPSPNIGLTTPGTSIQMPVGQMPVRGATDCGPEH